MNFNYCGKTFNVALTTHLIGATVKDFLLVIREALNRDISEVVVDFAVTELIDSTAVGTLMTLHREAKQKNITITLKNCNDDINKLLAQTGLSKVFLIQTSNDFSGGNTLAKPDTLQIREEIIKDKIILHLTGRMNHTSESNLFKQKFSSVAGRFTKILIDFTELSHIDSLGISSVMLMYMSLKEKNGKFAIYGANNMVEDVFTTFEIHKLLPNYSSCEAALKALDGKRD